MQSPRKITNIYIYISMKKPTTQEPDTDTGSTINMSFLLVCLLISAHHIKKTHSLQRRNPQLRNGMPRPILRKLLLEDRRIFFFNLYKFLSNPYQFLTPKNMPNHRVKNIKCWIFWVLGPSLLEILPVIIHTLWKIWDLRFKVWKYYSGFILKLPIHVWFHCMIA